MIPDSGNRTVTIKLENLLQRPPFKYMTAEVVGWTERAMGEGQTRYVPMVWNQWTSSAMPFTEWIDAAVQRHKDDTDVVWSVTYSGLDTATINVRVEQP